MSELFKSFSEHTGRKYLVGLGKPLFKADKSTPLWKIIKQANKTTDKAQKFLNKINSAKLASISRAKSIPENATIRKEYVNCGKSPCHKRHGAYYYAYWKDKDKKLRKYFRNFSCSYSNY